MPGVTPLRPKKMPADQPHNTDMGNSARMSRQHDGEIKYSRGLGWLAWDGARFARDDGGEIERRARETVKEIYIEAANAPDKESREALAAWAVKSESEQKIKSMISLCRSEANVAVRADVFDRDPFLLNCTNGTLDLRTRELRPHNRADLLTKVCGTRYDEAAVCPVWEKFLAEILPDKELVTYVRKLFGLCLSGDASEQMLNIFWGSGGNGKSTLANVMWAVLGDYAEKAQAETLLTAHRSGGTARSDIVRLQGARLVTASESEAGRALAEALVKELTGNEPITARPLYQSEFTFEVQFKLILSTNHKPSIRGNDYAIWRRIRLVPFVVKITDDKQDKALPDKLRAELPGILRWAVEGYELWREKGLEPPEAVRAASAEYKAEQDVLADFLAAKCEDDPEATTTAAALYSAYMEFSDELKLRARDILSNKAFNMALTERGIEGDRSRAGKFYYGLKLKV